MKTEVQIQTKPYMPEKDMDLKPVLDRICQELDIGQARRGKGTAKSETRTMICSP